MTEHHRPFSYFPQELDPLSKSPPGLQSPMTSSPTFSISSSPRSSLSDSNGPRPIMPQPIPAPTSFDPLTNYPFSYIPDHPSTIKPFRSDVKPSFPMTDPKSALNEPQTINRQSYAIPVESYPYLPTFHTPDPHHVFTASNNGFFIPTPSASRSTSPIHAVLPNPFQLSDFELFNTIGTGTFGRVYLCRLKKNHNMYFALKMMQKSEIVRLKQLEHVYSEKNILAHIEFPFIVKLFATFQNNKYIYMLLEYAIGGELFSYLRKLGRFSLSATRFYAAEIVLTLEYLHDRSIVYRDLKPENLLLDARGHIKITDFGFAKVVPERTWTLCGTPEYLAPEIIQGNGHGKEVDWWALGILIYEMLIGYPPFYDSNPFVIYEKILNAPLQFPENIDPVSKDIISRLLSRDKHQRLGNLKNGALDIKQHPWFRGVSWSGLLYRTVDAPFRPHFHFVGDTGNFDPYPELEEDPLFPQESKPFIQDPFHPLFSHF